MDNNNSSRIIVTTRMDDVAKACSPPNAGENKIHKMQPLKLEDSRDLFVQRVFGPGSHCPRELKETMEIILKKCGGLPLAIVSIASLLARYSSQGCIETWQRVCNSIGFHMENNPTLEELRQIVTLSYNSLPHHLKTCMMYPSIFPEDYVIKKKRELYRWVAEGLVVEKRGLTLLQVAESYFDELVSGNMIEATKIRHDGAVSAGRVHDIMLEIVISKSLEEKFLSLVGSHCGGTSHDTVRRLSIQGHCTIKGMDVHHIRSLSTFGSTGHLKFLDRLPEFTLLRVLDLEDCDDVQDYHVHYICRLYLLRFLSLRNTNVCVVPSEIGSLQHLQTLNLHGTFLRELPESVTKLEKLEHLYFTNKGDSRILWTLPKGVGKMKALRLARKVSLKDDVRVAQEIRDLTQLQDIEFVLSCTDQDVLDELSCSLGKITTLRTLKVAVADHYCQSNNMNFLLKLPPSSLSLLRSLRIEGRIANLPSWIESLRHLITIKLCCLHIGGDRLYGVLCKLPNLTRIDIEWQVYDDYVLVTQAKFPFPALKELRVTPNAGDTPAVLRFEKGAMSKLEKLMLEGMQNLKVLKR